MKRLPARPQIPATLSEADLWALVGVEESSTVDFKEQLPKPGRLQDPCVAFANHRGGLLVVGVSKHRPHTVLGTAWDQTDEERVQEAVRATQPPLRIDVATTIVGGRRVAFLRIEAIEDGWVQTSDGRVLVRSGPTNRALVGMELLRFLRERAAAPVEDEIVPGATLEDLDLQLVRRYLDTRLPNGDVGDALRDHGWTDPAGHPRLAALLLFGREPQRQNRRFGVDVLRFAGRRSDQPILRERTEVHGPLPTLVEQVATIVHDELRRDDVVRGLVREQVPAYPPIVVREALLNAVAHRDYSARGAAIQVRIYDDVLEVESPGTLPAYVTVETLREAQYSRNERIMDALQRLGLVEEAGQGIDRMHVAMEDALLDPPEFEEGEASFVVRLASASPFTAEERLEVARFKRHGLGRAAKTAIAHVVRHGSITNEELRNLCELDRDASRRALRDLVARGIFEQVGERRGARYVLVGATSRQPWSTDNAYRAVRERAERQGSIENADVRELLDIDREDARRILTTLVAAGVLEAVGERRGRRYLPVARRSRE